ncbi:MAG: hypothetical protein ACTSRT_03365 [Promethearchaeota archaeon]
MGKINVIELIESFIKEKNASLDHEIFTCIDPSYEFGEDCTFDEGYIEGCYDILNILKESL